MDMQNKQRIREHLRQPDVQNRIWQAFQRMREEATMTISGAAALTGFSENQLRDWEERSLLNPLRSGGPKGHRLYPLQELGKLALIRELIKANFSPGDIPPDIDELWHAIERQQSFLVDRDAEQLIQQRLENARKDLFWRYYVSHALHLSLILICDSMPNIIAGLILPLEAKLPPSPITHHIEDLPQLGESLVARLGGSGSSHTLLTQIPAFEYSTDFRLLPLTVMREDQLEGPPSEGTLIFLQRNSKLLTLSAAAVEVIQRLLRPIYEDAQHTHSCFGLGMRDVLISSTNLHSDANYKDIILNGLTEMVVRLGGNMADGKPRWRFCCILLPESSRLPLHQKSLIVQTQSKDGPYKKATAVNPNQAAISPSIRALQSGHIVYLRKILATDTSIPYRNEEGPIRSALAIPIGGEDGLAVAVLYVVSDEEAAFSEGDQRVLRIICRMVEELLQTYNARRHAGQKLMDVIERPALVDSLFRDFLSGNDFIRDVEGMLGNLLVRRGGTNGETAEWCVSFISIDVDRLSSLTNKYGELVTRNLVREVGLGIQEHFRARVKEHNKSRLYHIYADRFYIMLETVPLKRTQEIAERLRLGLPRNYKLDALRTSINQPTRPESLLELSDITVRFGVTSYWSQTLQGLLSQYPSEDATVEARATIGSALDRTLDLGRNQGGNIVIAWDEASHNFVPLPKDSTDPS